MKKKSKRFLSAFLAVIMLLSAAPLSGFPVQAANTVASGECGDNLSWTLDSNGVLTISGKGEMVNSYDSWHGYEDEIKTAVIGNGVTSICERAFYGWRKLTSIAIGRDVKSIAGGAFYECYKLSKITVNSANRYYSSPGGVLFNKAQTELIQYPAGKSATSYAIPNSVTSIGDEAFYECYNLASITIPNSVISIGGDAFFGTAYYINKANWSGKALYIGNCLIDAPYVEGAYSIKSGTRCIADYAFFRAPGYEADITSVTIPNSVISIGNSAFVQCGRLTNITIGSGVKSIGDSAFDHCRNLLKITVNSANRYYSSLGGVLFNKAQTKLIQYPIGKSAMSYAIPNSVTSIGNGAFSCCDNLTSVTITNRVTSIGDWAFYTCDNLTSVTIPNSLKSIGEGAFYGCSFTSITIPNSVTSIGKEAFALSSLAKITVNSANKYIHRRAECFSIRRKPSLYNIPAETAPQAIPSRTA